MLDALRSLIRQGRKPKEIDDAMLYRRHAANNPSRFDRDQQGADLPRWGSDGVTTTHGRAVDGNGNVYETRSGHQREDRAQVDAVNERLQERGMRGRSGFAHHAEQKFAARMYNEGIDDADLVINHPDGPCDYPKVGCDATVRQLLGPGQTLRVHWRDESGVWQTKPFEGDP